MAQNNGIGGLESRTQYLERSSVDIARNLGVLTQAVSELRSDINDLSQISKESNKTLTQLAYALQLQTMNSDNRLKLLEPKDITKLQEIWASAYTKGGLAILGVGLGYLAKLLAG